MTSSSVGAPLQRRESLPVRPRVHRNSTTSYRSYRSRRDSTLTDAISLDALSDDDLSMSMEDEEWERGEVVGAARKKRKRDEPMSPVMVVREPPSFDPFHPSSLGEIKKRIPVPFPDHAEYYHGRTMAPRLTTIVYVVFFYIIWQILTRSDDTEILGHLPLTHLQSLSSSLHSDLRPQSPYHLPYHLPQIPSPVPNTTSESTSTFRTILGVIVYPVYLLITLIATPLPLLLNALHLLGHVLGTVLYPITATSKLLGRTFILAPLGVASSVLAVFYPVYVFVAGVIGIGCVLGLGAGWIGKMVLDLLFGSSSKKKTDKRSKSASAGKGRSERSRSSAIGSQGQRSRKKALSPSTEEEREQIFTPEFKSMPIPALHEEEDFSSPITQYAVDRKRPHRSSSSRYDRDAPVVGIRKRGIRDSWSERQSTAW